MNKKSKRKTHRKSLAYKTADICEVLIGLDNNRLEVTYKRFFEFGLNKELMTKSFLENAIHDNCRVTSQNVSG